VGRVASGSANAEPKRKSERRALASRLSPQRQHQLGCCSSREAARIFTSTTTCPAAANGTHVVAMPTSPDARGNTNAGLYPDLPANALLANLATLELVGR
jgi:hypothetical protein